MPPLSTSSSTIVELTVISGSDGEVSKTLKRRAGSTVIIGRASKSAGEEPNSDNGLFRNQVLSRQHALIEWKKDGVYIKDMKSTHGTRISNQSEALTHTERRLNTGDVLIFGKTIVRADGDKVPRSYEPLILQATVTPSFDRKTREISASGPQAVLRKYVLSAKEQLFTDEEEDGSESSSSQLAGKRATQDQSSIISDDDEEELPIVASARRPAVSGFFKQNLNPPSNINVNCQPSSKSAIAPKEQIGSNNAPIVIDGSDTSSVRANSPVQASSPPSNAPPSNEEAFVPASTLLGARKQAQGDSQNASQHVLLSSQADEHPSSELETPDYYQRKVNDVPTSEDDELPADSEEEDGVEDEDIEEDEDAVDEDDDDDGNGDSDEEDDGEEEGQAEEEVHEIIHIGALLPVIITAGNAEEQGDEMENGSDIDDDDENDEDGDGGEDNDDDASSVAASDEEEEDFNDDENEEDDEMSEGSSQIFDTSPVKISANILDTNASSSSEVEDAFSPSKRARLGPPALQSAEEPDGHVGKDSHRHNSPATNAGTQTGASLEQTLEEVINTSASFFLTEDGRPVNTLQPRKPKKAMRDASTQMQSKKHISLAIQTLSEGDAERTFIKSKKRTREVMVETDAIETVDPTVEHSDATLAVTEAHEIVEDVETKLQNALPAPVEERPKKGLPWRAAAKYTSAMALGAVAAVIGLAAIPDLD